MLGLALNLTGIFSFFRVPYNSLLMDTYLFPPKTTVVGMLGAATGWNEEEFLKNINRYQYGLIINHPGELVSEVAAIYKSKNAPIYPITKNMVYRPSYSVFLASKDNKLIEESGKALRNPKYIVSLGDSENLLYPNSKMPEFVRVMDVTQGTTEKIKCILPSEVYHKHVRTFSKIEKDILPPKETKIPVDFTGKGKNRRFVPKNVFYYSGIELNLKKPLEVSYFDREPVYLF